MALARLVILPRFPSWVTGSTLRVWLARVAICLDNLPAYRGMSSDGSVLVGTAFTGNFTGLQNQYVTTNGLAFRWVFNSPAVTEIPRPAGGTWSSAIAISPNGNLTLTGGNSTDYPFGEVWVHNATTNAIAELGSPNTQFTPRLFGGMTALENLMVAQHNALMRASGFSVWGLFGLPNWRSAERRAVEKAKRWLERINLVERADDPAGELPYGDQRRLEIARAMCTGPSLLCLDEPAAGVPKEESGELFNAVANISSDVSILFIEHDMDVVFAHANRVIVLDRGRLVASGTPQEVRADPEVQRIYLGSRH